jgi:thermostable 8-oxoguanine DNA glycosylase
VIELKTCTKCKLVQKDTEFYKKQSWCRSCLALYRRENKEKFNAASKRFRQLHPTYHSEYLKSYRQKPKVIKEKHVQQIERELTDAELTTLLRGLLGGR